MAIDQFISRQRHLPHWQNPGSIYFLTWRSLLTEPLSNLARDEAMNAIRFWHSKKWFVYSAIIMPDHVHALVRPLVIEPVSNTYHDLSDILESVKGYSSRRINLLMGRQGVVWEAETFDRIVRDGNEFEEKRNFIRNNCVEAGLSEIPESYPWLFENTW